MKSIIYIFILAFFVISCNETGTTNSPIDEPSFDIYADSSYYRLTFAHLSHIYETLPPNYYSSNQFNPVLDLKIALNNPEERSLIKKIIIYDEEGLGWDFGKNVLEDFYSDTLGGYQFNNLLMNSSVIDYDKLFSVQVIGEENQRNNDYNFIVNGDLPFETNSTNYWLSSSELEFEAEAYSHSYNNIPQRIRGYNPISKSDIASIYWLSEDKNAISNSQNVITEFDEFKDSNVFYYSTNEVPQNAVYTYSSFTEKRPDSEYRLISAITPIVNRLEESSSFYSLPEVENRLLFSNDAFTAFLTPNAEDLNNFLTIELFDNSNGSKVSIVAQGSFYNDHFTTYFDNKNYILYYFNSTGDLYSYNLTTGSKELVLSTTNLSLFDLVIFPFGENLLITVSNNAYILNPETKESKSFAFGLPNSVNSYYYSPDLNTLFFAENNRRFYKVIYNEETQTLETVVKYNSINSNTSYSYPLNLHFSKKDSSLIHTSGFVFSIKKESSFAHDSSTLLTPTISNATSSVWNENANTLIVTKNYSEIASYSYDGSSFTKIGTLGAFEYPLTILESDNEAYDIQTSNFYYQGRKRNRVMLIRHFSLDNFLPKEKNEKINSKYYEMKFVRD